MRLRSGLPAALPTCKEGIYYVSCHISWHPPRGRASPGALSGFTRQFYFAECAISRHTGTPAVCTAVCAHLPALFSRCAARDRGPCRGPGLCATGPTGHLVQHVCHAACQLLLLLCCFQRGTGVPCPQQRFSACAAALERKRHLPAGRLLFPLHGQHHSLCGNRGRRERARPCRGPYLCFTRPHSARVECRDAFAPDAGNLSHSRAGVGTGAPRAHCQRPDIDVGRCERRHCCVRMQ